MDQQTDSAGQVHFVGCPQGEIRVRGQCPGYAPKRLDPFNLQDCPPGPVLLSLERAGRISGRCTQSSRPVRDFTIVFWQSEAARREYREFHGSDDGLFVIDEAPLGDLNVLAYADTSTQSPTQRISVSDGATADLELALPLPLIGRGHVVDGLSGEPLPRAIVQVNVMHENVILKPKGPPLRVDSKGDFVFAGVVSGYNGLTIAAPGYAARAIVGHAEPNGSLDFGTVALFSTQQITVQLVADDPLDWSATEVELVGTRTIGPRHFTPGGHVVFAHLDPGPYTLRFPLADGDSFDWIVLPPGRDLTVVKRLFGRRLQVEVVMQDRARVPDHLLLRASYLASTGSLASTCVDIPDTNRVELGHVEGSHVVLAVEDWEGRAYGCERFELGPIEPTSVQVHASPQQRRLRVLDSKHLPVEGAHVTISLPGDTSGWMQHATTDGDGFCSLGGISLPSACVSAYHYAIGLHPSTLVSLDGSYERTLELDLTPTLQLALLLAERDAPVTHVEVWSEDGQGVTYGLGSGTSNEQGLVSWGPVEAGDYRISIRQPGYWPSSHRIHLGGDGSPATIQVRRVGSVEFQIKTTLGNAAPGVEVAMRSDESGELLSDWIASGQVIAPSGGPRSNADGRLRLNALPNGPFHWTVTTADGETVEGEVTVPPLGLAHVDVTVP
ncbi:MAG TPA: carboxypeptidase-like regulatory domain-containing protein [Planctomycetota bacterium]|nr:carboxypeptidase-like regulatory domain-containing protein [Planctomycetota bacterium]